MRDEARVSDLPGSGLECLVSGVRVASRLRQGSIWCGVRDAGFGGKECIETCLQH